MIPPHRRATISNAIKEGRFGYQLLGEEDTEGAVAIFRLNVERFPESANVYDSAATSKLRQQAESRAGDPGTGDSEVESHRFGSPARGEASA